MSSNQAVQRAPKVVAEKPKQKPLAFVNWETVQKDEQGFPVLRSSRGFAIFDNEHTSREEKALVQLAKDNDGSAIVTMDLRIIIPQEKPENIDTAGIQLVKK